MGRFCAELGLSNLVEAETLRILGEWDRMGMTSSSSPVGSAAAAIGPVGLPRVDVAINGAGVDAIFDTGANLSVLSTATAQRLGVRIVDVDPDGKSVTGDDGSGTPYDTLPLATGSSAWMPPIDGLAESRPWTNRPATTRRRILRPST